VVGQHDEAGRGVAGVQVADLDRAAQRAEVHDRHLRLVGAQDPGKLTVRDVVRGQLEVGILGDQRAQAVRDEVFEAGEGDGDGGTVFHPIKVGASPLAMPETA
jgi:hypothetical protein